MGTRFINKRFISVIFLTLTINLVKAGPPYFTDDPDPVHFRHWEYYLSSQNSFDTRHNSASGTIPHIEINYGVVPDVQLHLVLPAAYLYSALHDLEIGYAFTEFGVKYRFVKESKNVPEIGIFPIIEIPTIKDDRFGQENIQVYLPVWFQKSWNKLTTYGGAGYWINPGSGNRNWVFTGWEVQYDFSDFLTLGSEIYYHSAATHDDRSTTGFNIGGSLNFSEHIHFIFSAGHSVVNENFITSYIGLYLTY
jgi:hypothetical protein